MKLILVPGRGRTPTRLPSAEEPIFRALSTPAHDLAYCRIKYYHQIVVPVFHIAQIARRRTNSSTNPHQNRHQISSQNGFLAIWTRRTGRDVLPLAILTMSDFSTGSSSLETFWCLIRSPLLRLSPPLASNRGGRRGGLRASDFKKPAPNRHHLFSGGVPVHRASIIASYSSFSRQRADSFV